MKKFYKNLFATIFFGIMLSILPSVYAAEVENFSTNSEPYRYTPPPPRYGPPTFPIDYGERRRPIYTPPPPAPNKAPKVAETDLQENLQEFGKVIMPVLPEKIRYRNSRRGPTRFVTYPRDIPRRNDNTPQKIYTQRHPKRPPVVYVPRRPSAFAGQRGSDPPKNFGPPRARYNR